MAADESPDPYAAAFFAKILRTAAEDVFHNGAWNFLAVTPEGDAPPDGLIAYEWQSGNSWKVIAVNLRGQASQGRVNFEGRPLRAKEYVFYDQLNDVRYVRSGDEVRGAGLFVRRDAYQAHIFDVSPVPQP
jgi:hypothetical protein